MAVRSITRQVWVDDAKAWDAKDAEVRACFCIGPQNGEPLCPCRMRRLTVKDGHWVEEIDYGPVEEG